MACDSRIPVGMTKEARKREIKEALARLEAQLKAGQVTVAISPNGAIAFSGWTNRNFVTDACAYRQLTAAGSWELRRAIATAEARTGRRVNAAAVASGEHSHDGGGSWDKGH